MKIAIDAGHGGTDSGAKDNGIIEKDFALDMATRIGHYLRLDGFETYETRPTNKLVGINTRAKNAVKEKCNLFLSIHCNAGADSAQGVEVFVAAKDERSRKFGESLIYASHGFISRGVKWDNQSQHSSLGVLRGTYKYMPAALLELGFCSNVCDAYMMRDSWHKDEWAKSIALAIKKYL
jgi:N-acetylmuramoyl-L-alanine amidase